MTRGVILIHIGLYRICVAILQGMISCSCNMHSMLYERRWINVYESVNLIVVLNLLLTINIFYLCITCVARFVPFLFTYEKARGFLRK